MYKKANWKTQIVFSSVVLLTCYSHVGTISKTNKNKCNVIHKPNLSAFYIHGIIHQESNYKWTTNGDE